MFRFQFIRRPAGNCRALLLSVACLLASPGMAAAASDKPDPEALLIEVYKELGANNLRAAQEKADRLVEAYPNFRLAHVVRGDLLLMHTQPVKSPGAVDGPPDKLRNMRAEARQRLRFLRERPDPKLMPRAVLQMREDQKHVLLVDAKRSRLFVYRHEGSQLSFVNDYYVSQGKLGIDKFREGDQKTPLGVYYVNSHLPESRLPEFYGTGTLPINYPNEWDKLNGHGGSGICLHGTPSDSNSRPPPSSDGCVVLTNPDLEQLARTVEVGRTPVVISDSIEFVSKARWKNERALATRLVENWRRDVESLVSSRVLANYSRDFKSERGEDLKTWFNKPQQSTYRKGSKLSVKLRDNTHFFYPGYDDMIVSTFTQDSTVGKNTTSVRKRQYWENEGGRWKIIYELTL